MYVALEPINYNSKQFTHQFFLTSLFKLSILLADSHVVMIMHRIKIIRENMSVINI